MRYAVRVGRRLPWWSPLVFMVPGSLYALAVPPRVLATSRLAEFPATFLGMSSEEIPATQVVLDELHPSDLLLRRYRRPDGEPLWLVAIFFQNARLGAHDPRLCYISQGFRLSQERIETTRLGSGQELELNAFRVERGGDERSVVHWWYVPGSGATTDQGNFRHLMMLEGFRRHATYGAFFRLSTPAAPDGSEMALLKTFAAGVYERLPSLIEKR